MLAGGCEVTGAIFADAEQGILVAQGEVKLLPQVHFGAGQQLYIIFIKGVIALAEVYVAVRNEGLYSVQQAGIGEAHAKMVVEVIEVIDHHRHFGIVKAVIHPYKAQPRYVCARELGGIAALL